ncbi:hypothetical protein KSP40_PGU015539 [Platanthera guangdongensis]|uniref:DNA/RNA-binding protein Alba-like domain-containing protein n=1 Tax=Platanthera guangdongensis TaxID=2320717 RepID=A0ABR2LRM7_9ASPA
MGEPPRARSAHNRMRSARGIVFPKSTGGLPSGPTPLSRRQSAHACPVVSRSEAVLCGRAPAPASAVLPPTTTADRGPSLPAITAGGAGRGRPCPEGSVGRPCSRRLRPAAPCGPTDTEPCSQRRAWWSMLGPRRRLSWPRSGAPPGAANRPSSVANLTLDRCAATPYRLRRVWPPIGQWSMDRYQRVEKPREEAPINENEIRITTQGRMRSYITYATSLIESSRFSLFSQELPPLPSLKAHTLSCFRVTAPAGTFLSAQETPHPGLQTPLVRPHSTAAEKGSDEIVFKAMGRAINKTVMIVESIKGCLDLAIQRRIADLHQNTAVGSTDITDTWEPLEEAASFSFTFGADDTFTFRYQPPLSAEQVKPYAEFDMRETSILVSVPVNGPVMVDYGDENWDNRGRGYGRGGWGRGRGRGFRGRGRGSYGGRLDYQQNTGGYIDDAPAPAPGRGILTFLYMRKSFYL